MHALTSHQSRALCTHSQHTNHEHERDGSVLYSMKYEDGDTEDLNEDECLKCIELNRKLESGEISRQFVGG